MNKNEFLSALEEALMQLPPPERRDQLEYYAELIDDMVEDGMDERDATERLGDVYTIAADILRSRAAGGGGNSGSGPEGRKKRKKTVITAACCFGALAVICGIAAGVLHSRREPEPEPTPAPTEFGVWDRFMSGMGEILDGSLEDADGFLSGLDDMDGIDGLIQNGPQSFAHDWDNEFSESGEYSVPAEALSSLDVDWTAGSVSVSVYDGSEIAFSESAANPIPAEDALRYGVENGTLYIQYSRSGAQDLPFKKLTVLVPEELAGELELLSVASVSAPLELNDLSAATATLATISGRIRYSGAAQLLFASSISGAVELSPGSTPEQLTASTVSGDVEISLAAEDWKLDYTTVSGSFSSDFFPDAGGGLTQVSLGSGPNSIEVSTTSGALRLNRA